MQHAYTMHPTERFDMLMQRVARATATLEKYLAAHTQVPEDVLERYDKAINDASDYAAQWGFDFSIDSYAA
jgi:hypothetical protein